MRVSVDLHATRTLDLPREASSVIATLRVGGQSFRVAGQGSAINRCRDCH